MNSHELARLADPACDPSTLQTVCQRLQTGADIGYTGPRTSSHLPNNRSALAQPDLLTSALALEVQRGHTAGPFAAPPFDPFRVSPLGARLKSDGSLRILLDLSQPHGSAVNDFIDKDQFTLQYTTMDSAIAAIHDLGPTGAMMAKIDLQHAFRIIPVRPDQYWLLGFQWNGSYYYDTKLSFGCRSSCKLFNDLADILANTVRHHSANPHTYHFLDDFWFLARAGSPACETAYRTMLAVCNACNIPISYQKCASPSTEMTLLGCVLNTEAMTISLPLAKLHAIMDHLQQVRARRTVRKRVLLSLIGKLVHAAKCVPAGRSFFRRLLDTAHSVHRPHHWVTLHDSARRDLDWWIAYLPRFNGTAPLIHPRWVPPSDLDLTTDASRVGYGGTCGHRWFSCAWPVAVVQLNLGMSWLEMVPVLAACLIWGPSWRGRRITFHCDNAGVVGVWDRGWL